MKAEFLLITLSLHGGPDLEGIKNQFDLAIDWLNYMPNCWLVRTTSDTQKWYRRLSPLLNNNDTILIVKVDLTQRAMRLPEVAVEWINEYIQDQSTAAFHSVNEIKKPAANRVYHNNNACAPGRDIPPNERRPGTGEYRLCEDCQRKNQAK